VGGDKPVNIAPVTLEGTHVRLEPLSERHFGGLCEVGLDEELWRLGATLIRTPDDMRAYIDTAMRDRDAGVSLPFATLERRTNRVVGSTRFGNIDRPNRRVEIGWTWIARPWQRTVVNTEAKYLMLSHAFETLKCIRVEFKTDVLNERSRNAILRIGAKQEGVFRNHMIVESGRVRDSVYFSIVDWEWADVKAALEQRLEGNGSR
jgi:RimJ/RimL family protein N-acetyltransferase